MPPKDIFTLRIVTRNKNAYTNTISSVNPSAYPTFGTAIAIPFIPTPIPNYSFTIRGLGGILTQNDLAGKLNGETITSFTSQSTDIFVTSSTTYRIFSNAFKDNTSITAYLDTGGGCTIIGGTAFQNSTIVSASFPAVTSIPTQGFFTCSFLTYVDFPNATTIGNQSFQNCNALVTASFPNATNIQNSAFFGCTNLRSINFPNATTLTGFNFYSCSLLVSASFPKVTSIGTATFNDCTSLSYINFPLVTSIESNAFSNCNSLVSASFPSASSIEACFPSCTSLKYINLPSLSGSTALGGSTGDDSVFYNMSSSGDIYIPSFYSQSNAGGLDGDLNYLSSSLNWTIHWL